jgi:hypothetical protein
MQDSWVVVAHSSNMGGVGKKVMAQGQTQAKT